MHCSLPHSLLFFFNDTATTEIYTLSLHDALPISARRPRTARPWRDSARSRGARTRIPGSAGARSRSEEHTSELQSLAYLVCRLLLEKKKIIFIRLFSAYISRLTSAATGSDQS